jgi:antitoxin PrlF
VAFDLRGTQVVVSRVDNEGHEDPAIASFLALLEKDIAAGKHVSTLPDELANALLSALQQPVDPGEAIQGDVAL